MTVKQDTIQKIICYSCSLLMILSLFTTTKNAYVNSDNAWYAVMGRSIAEGNIILDNHIASTILHYFPYGVVEAFWSVFIENYSLVHTISIVTLTILLCAVLYLSVKILLGKSPNIFSFLSICCVIITISPSLLTDCFTHIASIMCTLASACLYYSEKNNLKSKCIIIVLLSTWYDNLNFLYFMFPIIFENILYYIKCKKIDYNFIYIIIGISLFVARIILLNSVGIIVPGAGPTYEKAMHIVEFEAFDEHISTLYKGLSTLFSAGFWGKNIFLALPQFIFFAVMIASFSIYMIYCVNIVKKAYNIYSYYSRFMIFIIFSISISLLFFCFSGIELRSRYLSGIFINILILLCYAVNKSKNISQYFILSAFLCLFLSSLLCQLFDGRYKVDEKLADRREIAKFIVSKKLHGGYAWFGNALSTNFVLNELRVAPLDNKPYKPFLWLVNLDVFSQDKFDFILGFRNKINKDWDGSDIGENEIRRYFGNPKETADIGRVRIYIFEDDISDKIAYYNKTKSISFLPENLEKLTDAFNRNDGTIYIPSNTTYNGTITFGPYAVLEPGQYVVSVDYKISEKTNAVVDAVYSQRGKIITLFQQTLKHDSSKYVYEFHLDERMLAFQFRTFYRGGGEFWLNKITLSRVR